MRNADAKRAFGGRAVSGVEMGGVQTKSTRTLLEKSCSTGVLRLANRGMTALPPELMSLNDIQFDGKRWWEETDLHTLDVSHNEVTALPEDMSPLAYLRVLVASYNRLTAIPLSACFEGLQKLDVSHNLLGSFPEAITACSQLQELDVSHNKLPALVGLAMLPMLQTLNASHNQLTEYDAQGVLKTVKVLNLSNNRLQQWPMRLELSPSVTSLDLSCNAIAEIPLFPPNLAQCNVLRNKLTALPPIVCPNLKEIVVGENKLAVLPDMTGAPKLSLLDCHGNALRSLEPATCLKQLTRLDASNNDLSELPPRLGLITCLTAVVLDGNPLRSVRREIVAKGTVELMKYLRSRIDEATLQAHAPEAKQRPVPADARFDSTVDVSFRKGGAQPQLKQLPEELWADPTGVTVLKANDHRMIEVIPPALGSLANLAQLELNNNSISAIPMEVAAVPLKALHLGGNRFVGPMPPPVAHMTRLVRLDLSRNRISSIGSEFSALGGTLQHLNLDYNAIAVFPEVICTLRNLSELQLASNGMTTVSERIVELKALSLLDLSNNELTTVPFGIGTMNTIRMLKLEGNRMKWLRQAVLSKGTVAVMEYLREKIPH